MGFSNVASKSRIRNAARILSLLVSAGLLLLPSIFKLDGKTHADWQQFLGRFHPLIVHLPISLILLVPLFEFAGRFRTSLREAAVVMLSLSLLGCMSAVALGYLLAYGGGETGAGITRHMWSGIALTLGVLLCLLLRPFWASGKLPGVYPGLLGCVFLLMARAAHQGGSLTHGDDYLTQYLPAPLKRLTQIRPAQPVLSVPDSFYTEHIHPVLDANCVACHGETKVKGGLRLDTYALLMKGGSDGPVVIPGQPEKSVLLERVMLPLDHKKFMPSEGKPPLKPEEITWIKAWVLQGASPTVASLVGVTINEKFRETGLPQVGDYSGRMAEIVRVEKSAGVTLVPISKHLGDGLILNTVNASTTFSDAQLAQFESFAPYIVEVELGRTRVTDACFRTLAKFTQLRAIHLEGTLVTGEDLAQLSQLSHLTYFNLSGTKVTAKAIAPLSSMKNLRHLYLYNTPAQPALAAPETLPVARSSL